MVRVSNSIWGGRYIVPQEWNSIGSIIIVTVIVSLRMWPQSPKNNCQQYTCSLQTKTRTFIQEGTLLRNWKQCRNPRENANPCLLLLIRNMHNQKQNHMIFLETNNSNCLVPPKKLKFLQLNVKWITNCEISVPHNMWTSSIYNPWHRPSANTKIITFLTWKQNWTESCLTTRILKPINRSVCPSIWIITLSHSEPKEGKRKRKRLKKIGQTCTATTTKPIILHIS